MLGMIVRSAAVLASGAMGGQLVALVLSPALTRLYAPSEFGVFGVYAAVLYMLLAFSSLRYEIAIPLVGEDEDARHLTVLAVLIALACALLVVPVVAVLRRVSPWEHWWVFQWYLPLGVAAAGVYNVFIYVRLREAAHAMVATTRFFQLLAGSVCQLLLGFFGLGVAGLVLGQVIGLSLGVSKLAKSSLLEFPRVFKNASKMREQLAAQKRLAIFDAPSALLAVANNHIPTLLLSAIFSPAAGGMYALAQRVFAAPLTLASGALSAALLSKGREIRELDADGFQRRQALAMRVGSPAAAACAVAALCFFGDVFGHTWSEAGPIAAWLVLSVSQKFSFDSLFPLYAIQGRVKDGFAAQLLIFLARSCVLLMAGAVFSLNVAVGVFSLASTIVYMAATRRAARGPAAGSLRDRGLSVLDALAPYLLVAALLFFGLSFASLCWGCSLYGAWAAARMSFAVRWAMRRTRRGAAS